MIRRAFFQRIFGGIAAAIVAPFVPKVIPPIAPQALAFNSKAFLFVTDALPSRIDTLYGTNKRLPEIH